MISLLGSFTPSSWAIGLNPDHSPLHPDARKCAAALLSTRSVELAEDFRGHFTELFRNPEEFLTLVDTKGSEPQLTTEAQQTAQSLVGKVRETILSTPDSDWEIAKTLKQRVRATSHEDIRSLSDFLARVLHQSVELSPKNRKLAGIFFCYLIDSTEDMRGLAKLMVAEAYIFAPAYYQSVSGPIVSATPGLFNFGNGLKYVFGKMLKSTPLRIAAIAVLIAAIRQCVAG